MKPLQKDLNAVVVIAAREVLRFFKDWKTSLAFSLMFPVLFLGILAEALPRTWVEAWATITCSLRF